MPVIIIEDDPDNLLAQEVYAQYLAYLAANPGSPLTFEEFQQL